MQSFLLDFLLSLDILLKNEIHDMIVLQNGIPGFGSVPRSTIWYRGKAKYGTGRKKPLTSRLCNETGRSRRNITFFSFVNFIIGKKSTAGNSLIYVLPIVHEI